MSADTYMKRLDRIGEAISNRPVAYRRGMDEFDTARRLAFITAKARRPGASAQEVEQAYYIASLMGMTEPLSVERQTHPFDMA